jgi:YetA-like protein
MSAVPGTEPSRCPSIELRVEAREPGERHQEPLTCGIPWPRGKLKDGSFLRLRDDAGKLVAFQSRVLDRWPDGSVRWLLLDWQASLTGNTRYWLSTVAPAEIQMHDGDRLVVFHKDKQIVVDTAAARFLLGLGAGTELISASQGPGGSASRASLSVLDDRGRAYVTHINRLEIEENGPLRSAVHMQGDFRHKGAKPLALFSARLHFFAGSPTVRFAITLRNPRKAEHPGGLWDLGNGGSVYFRDAYLTVALPPGPEETVLRFSVEPGTAFESSVPPLEIYQDSSGGANWRSSNHVNRHHVVPNTFCGYRLRLACKERTGRRAIPVVCLTRGKAALSVAMPSFWQNFPKAVEASKETLVLRLFPSQYGDVHELQGGEQKTHEFYVAFGPDQVTKEQLAWARSPLHAGATPEWYCASSVVPYLIPRAMDPNEQYVRLVDAAIQGVDTFESKREVVDEYGWRHFGDIYGDHEAVFHKGPVPLVSHYNNQYDAIAGFAFQYLRSGDVRWFRHMDELATHVTDIDIYHTDRDKAAYNHGLFWHTFHYVDADTCTHRSYPRAGKVCGGGPANEQNYTTGLLFHYFLTGNRASREAALELSRWVVDMDDGNRTVFRWLARGYTGLASSSRTPSYHGPGRGAANSVAALLDGHRLSGDPAFLAKAEQLIRRCIHPVDNVPARNLLDAENRWFYTMFLQTLGRYLDYKAELGELDVMYAYARASLLRYALWMAEHEYPYLDKPNLLEYPTETWAAQDMRKSEVFKYAARHSGGEARARFLERSDFFFRYATSALSAMRTRTLARPVVLLLSFGFMHAWFQQNPMACAPLPAKEHDDFGQPVTFVPQKTKAIKRLKILLGTAVLAGVLGLVCLIVLFQ